MNSNRYRSSDKSIGDVVAVVELWRSWFVAPFLGLHLPCYLGLGRHTAVLHVVLRWSNLDLVVAAVAVVVVVDMDCSTWCLMPQEARFVETFPIRWFFKLSNLAGPNV